MRVAVFVVLSFLALPGAAGAVEPPDFPIRNWDAPRFYQRTPGRAAAEPAEARRTGLAPDVVSVSGPLVFVSTGPCRVLDTRGLTPPSPAYGAPALAHQVTREFQVGGKCGIPVGAEAVSANATVTATGGAGYLALWEAGQPWNGTSTLNFSSAGQTVANAAVVPLSGTGTLYALGYVPTGTGTTEFLLDVNGYYASDPMSGPFIQYTGVTQTFPHGVYTVINWTTPVSVSSDAAGLVTTGANWTFRAPRAGVYQVTARLYLDGNWSYAGRAEFVAVVNGLGKANFGGGPFPAPYLEWTIVNGTTEIVLAANDLLSLSLYHWSGVTLSADAILGSRTYTHLTIRFVRPFP